MTKVESDSVTPVVPARTWVVAPAGAAGASVAGTLAAPWSFAYAAAGADGRIQPSDTVWLRAGTYRSERGFTISFNGAPGQPVRPGAASVTSTSSASLHARRQPSLLRARMGGGGAFCRPATGCRLQASELGACFRGCRCDRNRLAMHEPVQAVARRGFGRGLTPAVRAGGSDTVAGLRADFRGAKFTTLRVTLRVTTF